MEDDVINGRAHAPRVDPVVRGEGVVTGGGVAHGQVRLASWVYAVSLAWWASSWNLRNSVLMAWSPIEPVWIGSAAVGLCVVHRLGQPLRLSTSVVWPVLVLVLGFLPGAILSSGAGYGPTKVASMIFVLLPVFCAAIVLLDSSEARWRWVWAQVLVGAAVAVAATEFNDLTRIFQDGRFTLATVDTISSSRLVGAAVVALLVHGLASHRTLWWTLPLTVGGGMVVVEIGSRGPLLAVLAATAIVVLVGRCFTGRRTLPVLLSGAAGVAAYVYARVAGGSGGERIISSLQSGFSDESRAELRHEAIQIGLRSLKGIGWGDFAQISQTGGQIANDQGNAYAHNVFAETFVEGGVLAVLVFTFFGFVALARLYRLSLEPREVVVLATLVYWLLNAQVSTDIIGNRFMWIALACGVASYDDARRRRRPGSAGPAPGISTSARLAGPTYVSGGSRHHR